MHPNLKSENTDISIACCYCFELQIHALHDGQHTPIHWKSIDNGFICVFDTKTYNIVTGGMTVRAHCVTVDNNNENIVLGPSKVACYKVAMVTEN